MINFTCDLCGKSIQSENEARYEVLVEVRRVEEKLQLQHQEPDTDFLSELDDTLQSQAEGNDPVQACESTVYDLCGPCQEKFIQQPIKHHLQTKTRFREN